MTVTLLGLTLFGAFFLCLGALLSEAVRSLTRKNAPKTDEFIPTNRVAKNWLRR